MIKRFVLLILFNFNIIDIDSNEFYYWKNDMEILKLQSVNCKRGVNLRVRNVISTLFASTYDNKGKSLIESVDLFMGRSKMLFIFRIIAPG